MGGKRLAFRGLGAVLMATLLAACAARPRPIVQHAAAAPAPIPSAGSAASDDAEDEPTESAETEDEPEAAPPPSPCPVGMALVSASGRTYCIDRYEASLVEVLADGTEKPYPHYLPVDGHDVRAVSEPGVFPQGYISELQAEDACRASGKRLCTHVEWKTACRGPSSTTFPYGEARRPGVCHDMGKSPVAAVFGAAALASSSSSAPRATGKASRSSVSTKKGHGRATKSSNRDRSAKQSPSKKKRGAPARASARPANVEASVWTKLNDPALGQVDGALAHTGDHGACVNEWGVYDMVGNLHEWVATDPAAAHGTFAGGYYLDTALNGDGCEYRTVAHAHEYHDYSTGFRCCADASSTAQVAATATK